MYKPNFLWTQFSAFYNQNFSMLFQIKTAQIYNSFSSKFSCLINNQMLTLYLPSLCSRPSTPCYYPEFSCSCLLRFWYSSAWFPSLCARPENSTCRLEWTDLMRSVHSESRLLAPGDRMKKLLISHQTKPKSEIIIWVTIN